jgi:predicted TIM-barrel fold metal-dependent hydrolase
MFFDTHLHLWDLHNQINNWVINSKNPQLLKNASVDDYLQSYPDTTHLLTIEAADSAHSLAEVKWLNNIVTSIANKITLYHCAYIDLLQLPDKFNQQLEQFQAYKFVVGFRHIMSYSKISQYSPCNDDMTINKDNLARLKTNLTTLAQNNYIFNCHMYPEQLLKIIDIINESKVSCIVDHCGLPLLDNKASLATWNNLLKTATNSNIYFKISGLDINQSYKGIDYILEQMFKQLSHKKIIAHLKWLVCLIEHRFLV